jgi:putative tryptophan/tyrosine transport system substrate-binding protein
MKRRQFLGVLVGAAAGWPVMARGQQQSMPLVAYLSSASRGGYEEFTSALLKGLAETGFIEGQNLKVEYRFAEGRYEQLPGLAAELTALRPAVLFANGPAAPLAKAATATIPIVFTTGFDPIALGLVSSLARPGGNVTGVSIMNVELAPKRLELMRDMIPAAKTVGVLVNPDNPNNETLRKEVQNAAGALGLDIQIQKARTVSDIATAFESLSSQGVGALVVGTDPFFTTQSRQLAELSLQQAIPTMFQYREFVTAGGLVSYGPSLADVYRQAGISIGRILKGEKPSDLPVPQVTKVEMMVNLKSAKTLGVSIPLPLLGRADEVIE